MTNGADLTTLLDRMLAIAGEENDRHAVLALKYYTCLVSGNAGFVMPEGKIGTDIFTEMEAEARNFSCGHDQIKNRVSQLVVGNFEVDYKIPVNWPSMDGMKLVDAKLLDGLLLHFWYE